MAVLLTLLVAILMALVLIRKYGLSQHGLRQCACNRLLCIYPSFFATGALGIVTIAVLRSMGTDPAGLNPQFMLPFGIGEWISNLAMFPFVSQQGLPVPVSAALFVEVWACALLPLFARNKSAVILGLAVTVCANLQFGFGTRTFIARYCDFATGLMPFAAGSVACHYRDNLQSCAFPVLSILVWCVHGLYWLADPYWPWTYGLFVSVPLSAWVVLSLAEIRAGIIDKLAGELSYPVYLLHTTVAAWFLPYLGFGRRFSFFAVSCALTLAASGCMLLLIDRPLQRLRNQTRHIKPLPHAAITSQHRPDRPLNARSRLPPTASPRTGLPVPPP